MNTTKAIAAAQKYLGAEATALSFNGLMLQVANKYLTTDRTALADAALDALNQYLTNDRRALSDAMYSAAIQYLAGDPAKGDPISAALDKYIAAAVIVPKTYADFQTHIATLATDGSVGWTATPLAAGSFRTTAASLGTDSLFGSSWMTQFRTSGSRAYRILQHGFPSLADLNVQIAGGREIFFRTVNAGTLAVIAVDRNGFLSQASGTAADTLRCDRILYYVDGVGAFEMNPSTGTGPTPYTIPEPSVAPAADILLDFVNGIYRVDGTTYASAAAAGFTGTGTFNASGYTATGAEIISGTVAAAGDYVIFSEFQQPATDLTRYLFYGAADAVPSLFRTQTAGLYTPYSGVAGPTSANCTRVAFGRSGGVAKTSYNNAAVSTGSGMPGFGNKALYIGNDQGASGAWGVPIRKIAVYKQTLTDAQIQALA